MERPYPLEEEQARIMCGDPQAIAYSWIHAYVENLNDRIDSDGGEQLTMDELVETAMSHVTEGENGWGEYIIRGGAFEGMGTDPVFWEKLALLKGIHIPEEKRNNFFSCSC